MSKKFQATFVTDAEIDEWILWARASGYNPSVIFRKLLHDYIDKQKKLGGGSYRSAAFEVVIPEDGQK